jgi:hypothetical protein
MFKSMSFLKELGAAFYKISVWVLHGFFQLSDISAYI